MEGCRLGLQCESGGTGWLLFRCLLAQLNVSVEVDIAGGKFRFAGTAIAQIKVILQFKPRYGLHVEEIQREKCKQR